MNLSGCSEKSTIFKVDHSVAFLKKMNSKVQEDVYAGEKVKYKQTAKGRKVIYDGLHRFYLTTPTTVR